MDLKSKTLSTTFWRHANEQVVKLASAFDRKTQDIADLVLKAAARGIAVFSPKMDDSHTTVRASLIVTGNSSEDAARMAWVNPHLE